VEALTFQNVILGFEYAGVLVLGIGALISLIAFILAIFRRENAGAAYERVRRQLEKSILLGLELLIVADIIRSVALDATFSSIGTLGLLVVVRTFLAWSLEVEIEGEWPWQKAHSRSNKASGTPNTE
jgi:uncharacterized membrane protein